MAPCRPTPSSSAPGGGKRNLRAIIKGLVEEKAVAMRGDTLHLTPYGYTAVGSFPPKLEAGHE